MAKKAKKTRKAPKVIDTDYEPRPNIRAIIKGRPRADTIKLLAKKLLGMLHSNIKSNMGGKWKPIQWGPKAGSKALQGTEEDWMIEYRSSRQAIIRPKRNKLKVWRGHTRGWHKPIVPVKAKALRFVSYGGSVIYTQKVRLPKRDPRPTMTQVKRIRSL